MKESDMQTVNDELMMPCAQCARKHLSSAIARYADSFPGSGVRYWRVVLARALVNLCECTEGYRSHGPFAIGLMVKAEEECSDAESRRLVRAFRLEVQDGGWPAMPPGTSPNDTEWYLAHVFEAEREYPDIRTAVDRDRFYRDNMSAPELRQAEVNYRLAQLEWLDENVFGLKAVEKGDDDMAIAKKAAVKPAAKAAVKAACKGGKAKKACKGCKK